MSTKAGALHRRAYPRAVEFLETDWERLVTFYDSPKAIGNICGRRT